MPDKQITVMDEKKLYPNVMAISSLCENGKHVVFWDIDLKPSPPHMAKTSDVLRSVQQHFHLSTIYIFLSRNGYNAVCLDMLPGNTVYGIKNETLIDDNEHLKHGVISNSWKLRIGSDKKIIDILSSVEHKYLHSNAHRIALNRFFNCNIKRTDAFDTNRNIKLEAYWCWKETIDRDVC